MNEPENVVAFARIEPPRKYGPTFYAAYDGECEHCFGPIHEGDEIRYIDDEIACEECGVE